MEELHKPRHIRDIAHLYLSRVKSRETPPRRVVLVTAASRNDFPGYHAANLALGFAQSGFSVQLFELSGLLPCAGYFLCLPPRVYVKHKLHSPRHPLSAVGGVTISFAAGEEGVRNGGPVGFAAGSERKPLAVELIHLPPLEYPERFEATVSAVLRDAGSGARAVVLAPTADQAADAGRGAFRDGWDVDWFTLSLGELPGEPPGERERTPVEERRAYQPGNLGSLSGWRRLLSDRVPCVLRDPACHLSRSYLSVCETLALSFGPASRGRSPGGDWHHESGAFARTPGAGQTW